MTRKLNFFNYTRALQGGGSKTKDIIWNLRSTLLAVTAAAKMQIWSYTEELVSQKTEEEQTKRNQSCVYVTTKKLPSSTDPQLVPSPVTSNCVLFYQKVGQ